MKIIAIVQARMGSIRLPNKVMREIHGTPMIELLLKRLARSKELDGIVVATSHDPVNEPLVEHVNRLGFDCEKGSESDVLQRYVQVARAHKAEVVVRITGDCPLVDAQLVDNCICDFRQSEVDYLTNTLPPSYPDGLDIEVVTLQALESALERADEKHDREHVTPYIRRSDAFSKKNVKYHHDLSYHRRTVDVAEDLDVIEWVYGQFRPNVHFSWEEVLKLYDHSPESFQVNQSFSRNQGETMGKGQKLWQRAKKLIPGGNMLLSKRAEMFLPDRWPAYFSRAKGCRVWDLEENPYIDASIMGIGTNILGYGHPEVDEAVRQCIANGNMSTLNCPEEVYLAEKLVDMHPWADMARFARSGGESNAIAIRMARATTGKEKVAICGYHGWHDWYLSANLDDESCLDGHLLPGLEAKGVPRNLRNTVFPFAFNDFEALELLVNQHDIGSIMMEVSRSNTPEKGYLERIRELADKNNIILIFDECTSAFRETFGGIHQKFGVDPDMMMLGKTLGNGYAITAVLGRAEIMAAAEDTFVSSTFWTERIGPTAAIKTLEIMERDRSWEQITATGKNITKAWKAFAKKHEIQLRTSGLPALTHFEIPVENWLSYKTLITQEMLKQGFLAANSIYVSTEHSPQIISNYFDALDPVFALIAECEQGRPVSELLEGPVCHGGFKRLN